jgi:hypothetical protein
MSIRDDALADPSVPQALKDLLTRIIPEKRFDELRQLVQDGALDPLAIPENYPLMSAVSQAMSQPEKLDWLLALFSASPESLFKAVVPTGYYNITDITQYAPGRYQYNIERPELVAKLYENSETPLADVLTLMPSRALDLLGKNLSLRKNEKTPDPLLHQIYNTPEFSIATLDRLEKLTGGSDFLSIKNARGETMFHRVTANASYADNDQMLDIASWMLQRKPLLVNEPDRFGWTPLDRLISRSGGKSDHAMGRFLIASNAKLEKQIAPHFNLAAELAERSGQRLEKPQVKKFPGLTATS